LDYPPAILSQISNLCRIGFKYDVNLTACAQHGHDCLPPSLGSPVMSSVGVGWLFANDDDSQVLLKEEFGYEE